MDLTPPALTRSPSSPSVTYCPSERSSLDYPSPGLVEQQYKLTTIYGTEAACSVAHMDHDTMGQSTWGAPAIIHPASSGAAMPSILSTEYDAFAPYDTAVQHTFSHHDMYSHQHGVHASATPPPSSSASRSPIPQPPSVCGSSGPFAPGTPIPDSVQRVKMEGDYTGHQTLDVSPGYPSPRSVHTPYVADNTSYAASVASGYLSDSQQTWQPQPQRAEYHHAGAAESYYPATVGAANAANNALSIFMRDPRRQQYRVNRPRRAPRRLTTREEANFQCEVKGCGKLFSRSYNYKAHMETHDEKREYPFPCQVKDCSKRFVRKTDLQRHNQSVHMKERSHKCDYCARLFARKDTLRRHMEDGCSKRFDIGTLDLRAEANYEAMGRPLAAGHLGHLASGGLPPMAIPPIGSTGILAHQMPPLLEQRDATHGHVYGR